MLLILSFWLLLRKFTTCMRTLGILGEIGYIFVFLRIEEYIIKIHMNQKVKNGVISFSWDENGWRKCESFDCLLFGLVAFPLSKDSRKECQTMQGTSIYLSRFASIKFLEWGSWVLSKVCVALPRRMDGALWSKVPQRVDYSWGVLAALSFCTHIPLNLDLICGELGFHNEKRRL